MTPAALSFAIREFRVSKELETAKINAPNSAASVNPAVPAEEPVAFDTSETAP